MNKKILHKLDFYQSKKKDINKLLVILEKIRNKFSIRNKETSFGKFIIFRKTNLNKFNIIEKIKHNRISQAFLKLFCYQQKIINKGKLLFSLQKLSISVLIQFITKKQKKQKYESFNKIKKLNNKNDLQKVIQFLMSISDILTSFNRRILLIQTMKKLKQQNHKYKKLKQFYYQLNSYYNQARKIYLTQSFSYILKEGFSRTNVINLKFKQQKILQQKALQLNKFDQIRGLKAQIVSLNKGLELQQTYKNKIKKEDYEKTLIIQAKSIQNQKINLELEKIMFQNENLKYDFIKKKKYLQNKQESTKLIQNLQTNFKKVYEVLSSQRTKQFISFRQISILLQRNKIDLVQNLKKFSLSKQNLLIDNIDLKNLVNLYEKQMIGFGVNVNIKESQTYKNSMEQNVNLRQMLEILFMKMLQSQTAKILEKKQQLSRLVEVNHNSQKGSKITFTTLASSLNGVV